MPLRLQVQRSLIRPENPSLREADQQQHLRSNASAALNGVQVRKKDNRYPEMNTTPFMSIKAPDR